MTKSVNIKSMAYRKALKDSHLLLRNAKRILSQSARRNHRYLNTGHVSKASGIAYLATLRAFDASLLKKGISIDHLPKEYYAYCMMRNKYLPSNRKLDSAFIIVYENLHLFAELGNASSVAVVKTGFHKCKTIIEILENLK